MAMINLGITEEEAKATSKRKFDPIPEGKYVMRIDDIQEGTYGSGRPNLKFRCAIAVHPDNDSKLYNRVVFYTVPLPWMKDNTLDNSGIGFLLDMAKGCGISASIDPATKTMNLDPSQFLQCTFFATIEQKPRMRNNSAVLDDDGAPVIDNEIKRVHYDR